MPLTDEQIIACLSHEGDRTAMLNAAYRMGMLRAAEIAGRRLLVDGTAPEVKAYNTARDGAVSDIRIEAKKHAAPKKGAE